MKKIITVIIFVFVLMLRPLSICAQSLDIPADIPYILIDSKTGRVLAGQNIDQRVGPASTTKILTAIVALENGDLQQEMKISQNAVFDIGRGGMNVGIMAGEEGLTLDHMLHLLLIKSANETANIIAENLAPSRSEYMDMMNQKAREIGAVNTTFVNPSGKDTEPADEGHLTTPADMAAMARYAMAIPKFREIVAMEYYTDMPVTNKHDDWGILRNSNQFLWGDNAYPYTLNNTEHKYVVTGIKTGYTALAGNNLVTAAVGEDGMEIIAVVMHVMQPNKIYGYSKKLMRYGFENYSLQTLSEAGQNIKTILVEDAVEGTELLNLVTQTGFSSSVSIGSGIKGIETKINVDSNISAPIQKGDVLGFVEYLDNGVSLGKVNLVAANAVSAKLAGSSGVEIIADESEREYSYVLLYILLSLSFLVILRMVVRGICRRAKRKKSMYKFEK